MKKLILLVTTALLAVALSTGAAIAKGGDGVQRTKSGLKYDQKKVTATMVTITRGKRKGKQVAVLHPAGKKLTAKTALYGLSCAGCDSCGADIDSTNGTVECRSVGCKPCSFDIIAGEPLQNLLQAATW